MSVFPKSIFCSFLDEKSKERRRDSGVDLSSDDDNDKSKKTNKAPKPPPAIKTTALSKGCKLRLIADSWMWEKHLVMHNGDAAAAQTALETLIAEHMTALNEIYANYAFDAKWTNVFFTLDKADIEVRAGEM